MSGSIRPSPRINLNQAPTKRKDGQSNPNTENSRGMLRLGRLAIPMCILLLSSLTSKAEANSTNITYTPTPNYTLPNSGNSTIPQNPPHSIFDFHNWEQNTKIAVGVGVGVGVPVLLTGFVFCGVKAYQQNKNRRDTKGEVETCTQSTSSRKNTTEETDAPVTLDQV